MNHKALKNALIGEKLLKLSPKDKQEIVVELLQSYTERQLEAETGINRSTLHDWKTGRQNHTGKDIHISLNNFYRKIMELTPEDITDWGRLKQIKERIEYLLRYNPKA